MVPMKGLLFCVPLFGTMLFRVFRTLPSRAFIPTAPFIKLNGSVHSCFSVVCQSYPTRPFRGGEVDFRLDKAAITVRKYRRRGISILQKPVGSSLY